MATDCDRCQPRRHLQEMHQNLAQRVDDEVQALREQAMAESEAESQAGEANEQALTNRVADLDNVVKTANRGLA